MSEIDLLRFPKPHREIGRRTEEHRIIARRFDKEFFDGSRDTGYGGYKYDGRWQAVAARLVLYYGIARQERVLDIGCGKGFLVKDLVHLGVDAYGYDVSEYAVGQSVCPKRTICADVRESSWWKIPKPKYKLTISINTLHNLECTDVEGALRGMMNCSDHQYITLDAYRTEEERQRMMAWNLTAKTILHVDEWKALFKKTGYYYYGDYSWFIP